MSLPFAVIQGRWFRFH